MHTKCWPLSSCIPKQSHNTPPRFIWKWHFLGRALQFTDLCAGKQLLPFASGVAPFWQETK